MSAAGPSTRPAPQQRYHPYPPRSPRTSAHGTYPKAVSTVSTASETDGHARSKWQHQHQHPPAQIPPSPPRSRRDNSETPSLGLGVAFGGSAGGKWWDEELPPPPSSLSSILESFRRSGEGDREMLLSILGAKKAEEERLTALIQTRLTVLQARLSLHSAAAALAAHPPERTPSLISSAGSSGVEGDSPPAPGDGVMLPPPPPPHSEKEYYHLPHPHSNPQSYGHGHGYSLHEHDLACGRASRSLTHAEEPSRAQPRLHSHSHSQSYRATSPMPLPLPLPLPPIAEQRRTVGKYFQVPVAAPVGPVASGTGSAGSAGSIGSIGIGTREENRSASPKSQGSERERGGLEMLLDASMREERRASREKE